MKRSLLLVVVVVATIATALDHGEAFGVPTSLAIAVPANGDGSVAIVCGILGSMLPRSVQCSTVSADGAVNAFDVSPNMTFTSISSGRDTICGLRSNGRTDLFCWGHAHVETGSPATTHTLRNVYEHHVAHPLRDLVVGDEYFAATDENTTFVRLWRNDSIFPATVYSSFHSLTSGAGFFCGIEDDNDEVACWGSNAQNIYPAFDGLNMTALSSGESHACGISNEGRVICGGNNDHGQSSPPDEYPPGELEDFALGSTHTCAVRGLPNRTVVCWGAGYGEYSPTGDTAFLFLVANGNLTCGLKSVGSVPLCWWTSGGAKAKVFPLPLRRDVAMGICTPMRSCPCGFFLFSPSSCANTDVVCHRCDGDPVQ